MCRATYVSQVVCPELMQLGPCWPGLAAGRIALQPLACLAARSSNLA